MEDITEIRNNILMMTFYCNMLTEGGFMVGGPIVTNKGYDMAMDLKESGWILTEKDIETCCIALNLTPGAVALIMAAQEKGVKQMSEEIKQKTQEK